MTWPLLLAPSACGPSFQAIYEGNTRFEHCYALDENPALSMPDKAACWRDWSEHYTYGQTRDRIHYATARYVALSEAPNVPTDEALMMAAPGETPRASTISAPTPTNAFAPPPKVLDPSELRAVTSTQKGDTPGGTALDGGATSAPKEPALPASLCADGCGENYRSCSAGCGTTEDGGGGRKGTTGTACQACSKTYRTCMRNCFK